MPAPRPHIANSARLNVSGSVSTARGAGRFDALIAFSVLAVLVAGWMLNFSGLQ